MRVFFDFVRHGAATSVSMPRLPSSGLTNMSTARLSTQIQQLGAARSLEYRARLSCEKVERRRNDWKLRPWIAPRRRKNDRMGWAES